MCTYHKSLSPRVQQAAQYLSWYWWYNDEGSFCFAQRLPVRNKAKRNEWPPHPSTQVFVCMNTQIYNNMCYVTLNQEWLHKLGLQKCMLSKAQLNMGHQIHKTVNPTGSRQTMQVLHASSNCIYPHVCSSARPHVFNNGAWSAKDPAPHMFCKIKSDCLRKHRSIHVVGGCIIRRWTVSCRNSTLQEYTNNWFVLIQGF